jgi:hypothetical protein
MDGSDCGREFVGSSFSTSGGTAIIRPAWRRRQWLKVVAWIEDHPRMALAGVGAVLVGLLFYAVQLNGFAQVPDAVDRWRLETFGGVIRRDRAIELAPLVIAMRREEFDRLDSMALGCSYLGINAFASELEGVLRHSAARIRIIGLDPRLASPTHPHHAEFVALAKAYGDEPWEFSVRCWHAAAALMRLQAQDGASNASKLEIRLVTKPLPIATAPWFDVGRSAQFEDSRNTRHRLDVLVPRPIPPRHTDSLTHPALLVVNRPKLPEVQKFSAAFAEAWTMATPLDGSLRAELLVSLDGKAPSGN